MSDTRRRTNLRTTRSTADSSGAGGDPLAPTRDGSASRRAGRNVVAVMLADILGKVITLAFTVLVARQLGATGFGDFSYALALGLLLGTFIAWGFDSEVARRGSVDGRQLDVALSQALVLRAVHTVPVMVVGGLIIALGRPDVAEIPAIVLVVLATVLDSFGDCGRAAATARERPAWSSFALVLQRAVACVLAIVVLSFGGGLLAVSAGYLLSSVVGLFVLTLLLRRLQVRPRFRLVDWAGLRTMWRSTVLLGLDIVLSMALFRVDTLMLGAIAGSRGVASYTVAYRLMETALFVAWAVGRSLFPAMARAGSGPALLRVGENALAAAGALLLPYGVLLLVEGERLLELVFGAEYGEDSVVSLRFLAFAPLAFALTYLTGFLLFAQGRKAQMVTTSAVGLIVNVALNVVLIPTYGARGASVATLVSYAVAGLLGVAFMAPRTGILRLDRSLLIGVVAALPMAAVLLQVDAPVLVEAVLGSAVYLASYAAVARWRAPEQLDLLRSLLARG
jgi:O-antigen/teichoic acid export membrane protein